MADAGRAGRGFQPLLSSLIETRRSSRRTRVRGISVWLDTHAQRKRTRTTGQYVPRLYYTRGVETRESGVNTRVRIPGGRLLFPRSYLHVAFR